MIYSVDPADQLARALVEWIPSRIATCNTCRQPLLVGLDLRGKIVGYACHKCGGQK